MNLDNVLTRVVNHIEHELASQRRMSEALYMHVPNNLDIDAIDALWADAIWFADFLGYSVQTHDDFDFTHAEGVCHLGMQSIFIRPNHPYSMLRCLFHELTHAMLFRDEDAKWQLSGAGGDVVELVCEATSAASLMQLGVTEDITGSVSYIMSYRQYLSTRDIKRQRNLIQKCTESLLLGIDVVRRERLASGPEQTDQLLARM